MHASNRIDIRLEKLKSTNKKTPGNEMSVKMVSDALVGSV